MPKLNRLLSDLASGDDQRAEACLDHLPLYGKLALESLLDLVHDEDPDRRWWALRALIAFKEETASDALIDALSDTVSMVRYCAALGLRYSPTLKAVHTLTKALTSPDRLFTRLAGDALIAIGQPAIPALAEVLKSPDPPARGEAARALAKMENPEAISALYSAAEDPSSIVQYWIEDAFEKAGIGMVYFKP